MTKGVDCYHGEPRRVVCSHGNLSQDRVHAMDIRKTGGGTLGTPYTVADARQELQQRSWQSAQSRTQPVVPGPKGTHGPAVTESDKLAFEQLLQGQISSPALQSVEAASASRQAESILLVDIWQEQPIAGDRSLVPRERLDVTGGDPLAHSAPAPMQKLMASVDYVLSAFDTERRPLGSNPNYAFG
ncbi:Hypothetical protein HDN1F_23800 [gamma proteobacterium HdN1]|nr:Hypothetical protein HDN1F_23800 [gamma proteobacterium HdN1]